MININRDRLDNRKMNLRITTQRENVLNSGPKKGQYKGVSWSKHMNKYRATVNLNDRQKHLGYYITEKEAAQAYNNCIDLNFDSFAFRNKIDA